MVARLEDRLLPYVDDIIDSETLSILIRFTPLGEIFGGALIEALDILANRRIAEGELPRVPEDQVAFELHGLIQRTILTALTRDGDVDPKKSEQYVTRAARLLVPHLQDHEKGDTGPLTRMVNKTVKQLEEVMERAKQLPNR